MLLHGSTPPHSHNSLSFTDTKRHYNNPETPHLSGGQTLKKMGKLQLSETVLRVI